MSLYIVVCELIQTPCIVGSVAFGHDLMVLVRHEPLPRNRRENFAMYLICAAPVESIPDCQRGPKLNGFSSYQLL